MVECPSCHERMQCIATRSWNNDCARHYRCDDCGDNVYTVERILIEKARDVFKYIERQNRKLQRHKGYVPKTKEAHDE